MSSTHVRLTGGSVKRRQRMPRKGRVPMPWFGSPRKMLEAVGTCRAAPLIRDKGDGRCAGE